MKKVKSLAFEFRRRFVMFAIIIVFAVLVARALQLQILHADFYLREGSSRQITSVEIPAHRGPIEDRNGEPLAISTPVYSISADPRVALQYPESIERTAATLEVSVSELKNKIESRKNKRFVYLKRHVLPHVVKELADQKTPGINIKREYRRYYPTGEMASHLIGLTNIDDQGLEGFELAYDEWLKGVSGKKKVLIDGSGTVIADIELMKAPRHGKPLRLSIDKRIQYLAYRELKSAVKLHDAHAGSVVILSIDSGEVLGVANYPAFNPNNRANASYEYIRNRAITDVFEPGSTIKPFLVATALDTGKYFPTTRVNTAPGYYTIGDAQVHDIKNYGVLDVTSILTKSSNVGAVRVALEIDQEKVWNTYQGVGFGKLPGSGFPGERAGTLVNYTQWNKAQRATLAYGYGMSTTALQLARAYSVIASDGILQPTTFLHNSDNKAGQRVMTHSTARQIREMLEQVVSLDGTGKKAMMRSYSAAGKTGTSRKLDRGKYLEDKHVALFAGFAPANTPKIVVVVVIDQPNRGGYYGGQVAAPIFSKITESALRLLNIAPQHSENSINNLLVTETKQ